jgi:hypothetical protein
MGGWGCGGATSSPISQDLQEELEEGNKGLRRRSFGLACKKIEGGQEEIRGASYAAGIVACRPSSSPSLFRPSPINPNLRFCDSAGDWTDGGASCTPPGPKHWRGG